MGIKLSDADKIGMSPEEIAALESADAEALLAQHGGTESPTDGSDATTGDGGGEEGEGEGEGEGNGDGTPNAEGGQAALSAEQLASVVDDEPAPPAPAPAPLKVEAIDYEAERKKLSDERREVERKWAAGEEGCTDEWRATELERIESAKDDLLVRHTRAVTLREQNEQAQQREKQAYEDAINTEVRKLLAASKTQGAAVPYATDSKAQAQFDHYLRAVEGDPDAASMTAAERVAEAHRLVLARRGIAAAAPAPSPAPSPAPGRREVPVTLSGLPNAGRETHSADILAELNTLSGEEYEKKLASLPAAQVERLMRQADNLAAASA